MAEPSMTPPGTGPTGAGPTPLDLLTARLKLPEVVSSRVGQLLFLAALSLAVGLLISPGLSSQQIPPLSVEDIGRPFRAPSASGFKAGRDYEIVDEAMTEQRRQEARAAVLPVFDSDPSVLASAVKALEAGFAEMRDLASEFELERQTQAAAEGTVAHKTDSGTGQREKEREAERLKGGTDQVERELTTLLLDARRRFEQHAGEVDADDYKALVLARFGRELEDEAIKLVRSAYRADIVALRDDVARVDAHGITIRVLGRATESVSSTAAPVLLDVREAHAEMDRQASIPGSILPDAPSNLRRAVLRLAKAQIRPNLTINIAETDARRRKAADAVKGAVIAIKKGQKVIGDGELINEAHLVILKRMRSQTDELDLLQIQLGSAGLVALLILGAFAFHRAGFRRFRPAFKDLSLLGLLLFGLLALLQVWVTIADAVHDRHSYVPAEALYYCFPIAAGAMLVRFLLSDESALFFAIVASCLAGVMLGNSLVFGMFALVGSLVAAERIAKAKDRVGVLKAGVVTGAVNAAMVLLFALAEGKGISWELVGTCLATFVGTSLSLPAAVMALTPMVEATFGYASDIKLLELANLNHPALKELIVQAPGTYHHSIIIGSLVEAAAESIGANPLLARSCAYYHDIGKGKNPLYFGENQKGENRHDSLAPAMSAVIIKRHVTEGLEMARQYKLPKLVADAIPQHHGTRLVGFFYHKALKEQEGKESAPPIDESIYRYAGPKPQFPEAALVMIADAVEAASRSMSEPTGARLQGLVQKLINMIFSEGQLDECDLTLRDLNLIAQSFTRTLEGIYHARPAYPPGAVGGARTSASDLIRPPLSVAKGTENKRGAGGS